MFFYFPISQRNAFNFTRSNVIPPLFSGKELRPEISICVCTHKHIHTIHVFGKTTVENKSILLQDVERVTGRKARGLQMEEIGCKCQTFFSLLSSRRKQASNIFFPSLYKSKKTFLNQDWRCLGVPTQAPVLITPEEPQVLITVGGQSIDFLLDTGQLTPCLLKPLAHFLPDLFP